MIAISLLYSDELQNFLLSDLTDKVCFLIIYYLLNALYKTEQ